MKFFISSLIIMLALNSYAEEKKTTCREDITECSKKFAKEEQRKDLIECANKASSDDKCKEEFANNPIVVHCKADIEGPCKDKKLEKLVECLRKSKNKECKKAVGEAPAVCPPNNCPSDFTNNDPDKIVECNIKYNEKNPDCTGAAMKSKNKK